VLVPSGEVETAEQEALGSLAARSRVFREQFLYRIRDPGIFITVDQTEPERSSSKQAKTEVGTVKSS
jgi:hypothetical protein